MHNSLTGLDISTKLCEYIHFHMEICIGILKTHGKLSTCEMANSRISPKSALYVHAMCLFTKLLLLHNVFARPNQTASVVHELTILIQMLTHTMHRI